MITKVEKFTADMARCVNPWKSLEETFGEVTVDDLAQNYVNGEGNRLAEDGVVEHWFDFTTEAALQKYLPKLENYLFTFEYENKKYTARLKLKLETHVVGL
jgi:hypothetical protein